MESIVRGAYTGGQETQLSPLSFSMGGKRGRNIELFPYLLSCKGAFCGIVDSLIQENVSEGKPPDPQHDIV